jgi:hypothetical protein
MRIAKDTQELLNANRRESWREYCNSLSYREDPRKVSNIIKAINREPRPPQNKSITSASGKTIHTDKGKCKAFRSMFSAISKRPHLCKGRLQRAVARRVKVENCNYMRYVIHDCGDDCDGDFTLEELKATIQNLPNRKAAGPDRIHNEMIKNASDKVVEELL